MDGILDHPISLHVIHLGSKTSRISSAFQRIAQRGWAFVVSPICVMESIPLLSNLHESSLRSLVVCSLYTQCISLLSIFLWRWNKKHYLLQRSFTKSAKLNWSHLLGFWPIIGAPFTQRTTCFCSLVVIHTCV